ncbi:MAG: hypothetical protein ACJA0Y_000185 [Maricaulis maris]|jgi:hypothetical protein|tara:strand:+ start:4160 stop:4477 length:318 start_codon:yes stop_codon:yes gene_type:complete
MAGRVFAGMPRVFGAALGQSVTYTPVTGDPATVNGVFSADYYAAMDDGAVQVESAKPAISLARADCPNAAENDQFSIDGTTYITASPPQPDSFGMVVFILHEVMS